MMKGSKLTALEPVVLYLPTRIAEGVPGQAVLPACLPSDLPEGPPPEKKG